MHAASFPLPLRDGEFGVNATRGMDRADAFVALTEYGVDARLAPRVGLFAALQPRRIDPAGFSGKELLQQVGRQVGKQAFFTASDRPFCLYVVFGSADAGSRRGAEVNTLLESLAITHRELR